MKNLIALTLIGVVFTLALTSCGSSKKKGGCDAYGSVTTTENSDLAAK